MFNLFASEGPHIAIAPEKLFEVGGLVITNSMVYGWIVCIVMMVALIYGARKVTIGGSRGPAQLLDAGVEFFYNMIAGSLGSESRARKYTPYFVTIFFFALIHNWLGLLPIVGKPFTYDDTALFRPFTADFNGTLAMSITAIVLIQTFAIKESGLVKHLRHYFAGSLANPITYLIGLMEIFQELTRLFSLALRLFLNVVIGEILIAIFAYLGGTFGFATAVPFTLMEVFIGLLQAYIFVLLSVSYLSVAIAHSHEHEETA
ncbi:MAG: F0F1 ATP synthase subunit A [Patescibacteria group bacterium]